MRAVAPQLSAAARARDAFGSALAFAFDATQRGSLPSPMPARFAPLAPAASVELIRVRGRARGRVRGRGRGRGRV